MYLCLYVYLYKLVDLVALQWAEAVELKDAATRWEYAAALGKILLKPLTHSFFLYLFLEKLLLWLTNFLFFICVFFKKLTNRIFVTTLQCKLAQAC